MSVLQPIVYKPTQEVLMRIAQDETKMKNLSLMDIKAIMVNDWKEITLTVGESKMPETTHHNRGCGCDVCYDLRNDSNAANKNKLILVEGGKVFTIILQIHPI